MAFGIKTTTMDMTRGPLFKKIILFTLPVIATNLLQVFYNMVTRTEPVNGLTMRVFDVLPPILPPFCKFTSFFALFRA